MLKDNNSLKISRYKLLNYIKKEQFAYKFGDSLLKFTEPQSGHYDCVEDDNNVKDLKWYIKNGENISHVKIRDLLQDDLLCEFYEIAEWASDVDSLINIEDALVNCVSAKNDIRTFLLG